MATVMVMMVLVKCSTWFDLVGRPSPRSICSANWCISPFSFFALWVLANSIMAWALLSRACMRAHNLLSALLRIFRGHGGIESWIHKSIPLLPAMPAEYIEIQFQLPCLKWNDLRARVSKHCPASRQIDRGVARKPKHKSPVIVRLLTFAFRYKRITWFNLDRKSVV